MQNHNKDKSTEEGEPSADTEGRDHLNDNPHNRDEGEDTTILNSQSGTWEPKNIANLREKGGKLGTDLQIEQADVWQLHDSGQIAATGNTSNGEENSTNSGASENLGKNRNDEHPPDSDTSARTSDSTNIPQVTTSNSKLPDAEIKVIPASERYSGEVTSLEQNFNQLSILKMLKNFAEIGQTLADTYSEINQETGEGFVGSLELLSEMRQELQTVPSQQLLQFITVEQKNGLLNLLDYLHTKLDRRIKASRGNSVNY